MSNNKLKSKVELSPVERWQKEKKLLQFKTILSLVLSNVLTFLLCLPQSTTANINDHSNQSVIKVSQGHSIINIKAESMVRIPINQKIKVSLINSKGHVITKGFLWPSNDKANGFLSESELKRLIIEVPTEQLPKISKLNFDNISVYPEIKNLKANISKRISHEIIF